MSRYIDITGKLSTDMWSYPDTPPFEKRRYATIEERGWEADWFAMPTLAGTYLETSKHLYGDDPAIDEIPVDRFFLPVTVAHIPKGAREHITVADLEQHAGAMQPGDALLVHTGWAAEHWFDGGSHTFVNDSPHFVMEAMEWILARKPAILGGDMPCFDDPQPGQGQGVNFPLFKSGALILAPLVNLEQVTAPRAQLVVLPAPLQGSCGAPCRAVIIQD